MNALNRILIILAVLVLGAVCVTTFIMPIQVLNVVSQGSGQLATSLETVHPWVRLALGALFSAAWIVVSILFLIMEVRRPRPRLVRVDKVDGGEVEVSLRTVEEHVAYEVDRLAGVLRVRSRVTARKGGVAVEVDVDAAGDMEVPLRAARVVEVVRRVVEEKVGVRLTKPPRVRMRATPVPTAQQPRPRFRPLPESPPERFPEPEQRPALEPRDDSSDPVL